MKISREIIGVIVLIGLFIVFAVAYGGHSTNESRLTTDDSGQNTAPDPSIYSTRSGGSQAAFTLVTRLGYHPVAWRRGWSALNASGASMIVIIDPEFSTNFGTVTGTAAPSTEEETAASAPDWSRLNGWIARGNTAVLLTSSLSATGGSIGTGGSTFADAAGVIVTSAAKPGNYEFGPSVPGRFTQGIVSIHSESDARVRQYTFDGSQLFGDQSGALVLYKPIGSGRLIVIADSYFLSNANLPKAENAQLLANVLGASVGSSKLVLFDEYHHGDVAMESGATLWTILGRPVQLAILQGLLAILALVAVFSVRFGHPIPALRGVSRSSGEYITSLAGLHRKAGASSVALETIYRHFLRDLCSRLGVAPDTRLDQLASIAGRRTSVDETALRNFLALCEQRLDEGKLPEGELLELVRVMELIRKDVGIA